MMVGTRSGWYFYNIYQRNQLFGIKVWINFEAKSGYVLNFQIYTGSEEKTKEKGLAYGVVMEQWNHNSIKDIVFLLTTFALLSSC